MILTETREAYRVGKELAKMENRLTAVIMPLWDQIEIPRTFYEVQFNRYNELLERSRRIRSPLARAGLHAGYWGHLSYMQSGYFMDIAHQPILRHCLDEDSSLGETG